MKIRDFVVTALLRSVSVVGALLFIIAQNGNDTCFIWANQPKVPERKEKFSIKDL